MGTNTLSNIRLDIGGAAARTDYDPTVRDPSPVVPEGGSVAADSYRALASQDAWEATDRRRAPTREFLQSSPVASAPLERPPLQPAGVMGIDAQTCLDLVGDPRGDVFTHNKDVCNHWAHAMEGQQAQAVVERFTGSKTAGVLAGAGLLAASEVIRKAALGELIDPADIGATVELPTGANGTLTITVFGPDRAKPRGGPSGAYVSWRGTF